MLLTTDTFIVPNAPFKCYINQMFTSHTHIRKVNIFQLVNMTECCDLIFKGADIAVVVDNMLRKTKPRTDISSTLVYVINIHTKYSLVRNHDDYIHAKNTHFG